MDSYTVDQVAILSADLVPFFGEPDTNMLLVKIVDVKLGKQVEDGLEVEIGPATLDVIDVLSSPTLKKGSTIEVPVKRIADPEIRYRNGINQWNNLDLTTGDLLLLSGRVVAAPNILMGQAAIHVDSVNDSEVNATRQCYTELRIEWLNYLGSSVLSEFSAQKKTDQSMRYALIRAMKTPAADQVTATLYKMERSAQAEEHERIKELMQVWHSSGAAQ